MVFTPPQFPQDALTPSPTLNTIPICRAEFESFPDALNYAAKGETGLNFYNGRGELSRVLPYRELAEEAKRIAQALVRAGISPNARMLIVADTTPEFMLMFSACQYASILPVPVAVPVGIGGREPYIANLRRQLTGSGAEAAMAPADLLEYLQEAAQGLPVKFIGTPADFIALPYHGADLRPFGPADSCYLQYSSGSTRFPLGVDGPQKSVIANARAITWHGLGIDKGDRCISWLPLYHDMGLVGFFLVPLMNQISIDYLATRDFARRPLLWLSLISRNRGTLSYSPSFGYDLAARRGDNSAVTGLDLSCWRGAGIGGDMIQSHVLEKFADTFAPHGFRRSAFVPSYGMAETTLAISFAPLNRGVEIDRVNRQALASEGRAIPAEPSASELEARDFVRCGTVIAGHELEIRDPNGRALSERQLGEIAVRGPSIMRGYFNEPEATSAALSADGWLRTGDLGYLVEGEVVITGRSKDLIIVNGRNIWPQDLEWAVEELPKLRTGDVAAFSIEEGQGEQVVVLIQCRLADAESRAQLVKDADAVIRRTAAIESKIVLVPPNSLPQTSSGKLSRSKAKANYLAGHYVTSSPG